MGAVVLQSRCQVSISSKYSFRRFPLRVRSTAHKHKWSSSHHLPHGSSGKSAF